MSDLIIDYKIPSHLAKIVEDLVQPFNLSMGEKLPIDPTEVDYFYFLLEGCLRYTVHFPSDSQRSITLSTYQAPYIAGLSTFFCSSSSGTITASEDSTLLRITRSSFLSLISTYSELRSSFLCTPSACELWNIFSLHTDLPPSTPFRDVKHHINNFTERVSIKFLDGTSSFAQDDDSLIIFADHHPSLSYGQFVNSEDLHQLMRSSTSHFRVIICSSSFLNRISNPFDILDSSPRHTNQVDSKDSTNLSVTTPEPQSSELSSTSTDFKFFNSIPGKIPEAVSCFKTVSHILNLPLKVDLLKKVLEDQSSRYGGNVSLQLCAAISESLGLKTQLVSLPVSLIGRLQPPAFIHLPDDELCVALASRSDKLLLSRPTSGIQSLTLDELHALSDDNNELSILVVKSHSRTPQKKFTLKWFYPALKKHKTALIEVLIASFFVQLFQLMNPLIVQQIIDKVIGQNGLNTLPVLAVLLFSFSIFENLLTAVRTNLFIDTTNRIDIALGEQVIDHLLRLPLSYFDKRPVGELSSRLGELEQIRSFLTGTALTVIIDTIFSTLYVIIMLFYSWILTIVALLVAPLLAILTFSLSPIIRRQIRSKAQLNANTQNHLIEVLTGIQTVKAQNFELKARWRWKDRYSKYIAEGFKNAVTSTTANGLTQFINQVSSLSVLCVGAYLVLQGQLSLGQLIAFRIISGYVTTPLLRLSGLYQNFQQTLVSLERLADIVDTPQESTDLDQQNIPLPSIQGDLLFEDVSFRFTNSGPLQVSQVNLSVSSGEFVALVGQSGSGKSTLTKLLSRLYEPNAGRILIDSMDISKVELYSLRSQIGIVPQDSLLFEGSVQDNIALSNPDASSDDVIAAAKVACAHEFIMTLPHGYASSVGERGASLSGGQRQRIAIARTVLQNPRLLIMDEATSALDYQTERLVSLNLMEHFRGRTVLFITHRLNSIVHADKIVMLHQGLVDEVGTHKQLLDLKGRYFALFSQQGSDT